MDTISFAEFQKIDIRIGTVLEAQIPQWSHWVIRLVVDFGPQIGKKTVFAGMMKFYKPEEFVDKQFPFVVNIEPKKVGPEGDISEAMMLAAGDEEAVLLLPNKDLTSGTRVR